MLGRLQPLTALLAAVCAAQAGTPVYKLLYSPATPDPIGELSSLVEVQPGVFYALSGLAVPPTFGNTIFSVSAAGTFKSIYVAPATGNGLLTLAQGGNGLLYASAYLTASNGYISISASGTNLKYFPFPGTYPDQWAQVAPPALAPPGQIYTIAGIGANPPTALGLALVQETGKINIVHQFTASEGFPNATANVVYGPDGKIYGVGNQQQSDFTPGFVYQITPQGAYSKLLDFPSFPANGSGYPLAAGSDGNLYGTFPIGGANKTGYVYQAALSGKYQVVADFPATGMTRPGGFVQALLSATDGRIRTAG
jgi:hypothetical protein